MPSPSTDRQLLPLPFVKGLSQKEDERHLEPGALITGNNCAHPKTNMLQKRPGFTTLALTGPTSTPGTTLTITAGRRLGRFRGALAIIAPDSWTDGAWVFDDQASKPVFRDRVPEVYGFPARSIAPASGVVTDADTAVVNGYAVHVWLVGMGNINGAPAPGTDIHYQVENAATGQVIIGKRSFGQAPINGVVAPKLVVAGTTLILGFVSGSNDYTLYATSLDSTNITNAWTAKAKIAGPLPAPVVDLPGGTTGNGAFMGVYDLAAVIGDATQVVFGYNTGSTTVPQHITLSQCSVAGIIINSSVITAGANIETNDSANQWVTDGSPHNALTGIAIRADSGNNEVAVAYAWNTNSLGGGGNTRCQMQIVKYSSSFGNFVASAQDVMTSAPGSPHPVASDNSPPNIAIERISSTGPTYKMYFSPASGVLASASGASSGSNTGYIASYIMKVTAGVLAAVRAPWVTYGLALASRILLRNSIGYVVGWVPSAQQGSYFLMADDAWNDQTSDTAKPFPLRAVACYAPRLATARALQGQSISVEPQFNVFVLPHLVSNSNADGIDVVQTLLSVVQQQATTSAPSLAQWDFASAKSYSNAELGLNMLVATGMPSAFDGLRCFELGFPYSACIVSLSHGATGSLSAGTYLYMLVYEWRDATGQLHRSGRSLPATVTVSLNDKVTLVVATVGFTGREKAYNPVTGQGPQGYAAPPNLVTIRLARTAVGGTEFFYTDTIAYVSGGGGDNTTTGKTAAIANNAGVPTLTIVDGMSDTLLQGNEKLYDDGGDGQSQGSILNNLCGPAFQFGCTHQNRYFGIDGNNVWPTKAFTTGEGSGFNELINFSVDDGPGYLTGAASLDDKLILFKRDRIFFMTGQGPGDDGSANDWSPPQRIASDLGCIDWRSIVVTPQGVYFMSDAGLRVLTRDLQVMPVPHAETSFGANPRITSAVVHPTQNRVRWTANTDETSVPRTGIAIDHEYILDSWLTASTVDGSNHAQGAISGVVAGAPSVLGLIEPAAPTYHWVRLDGTIYRESNFIFLDGVGVYAPMTVETAWIKSEGLVGFGRFRRLIVVWEPSDTHTLSVSVAYDFDDTTYYSLGSVTSTQQNARQTPKCEWSFPLQRQRAQSVRFKITEAKDGSTTFGGGPILYSLGLEWVRYTNRRIARLPGSQRV